MVALTGPKDGLDPAGPYADFSCRVQAAVDMYGPADLRRRDKLLPMLGKAPAEAPDLYAQASPIIYGDKNAPPLLLIHGTGDQTVPVQQSRDFAAALTLTGAPPRPKEMDLRPVVFTFFDQYLRLSR